MYYAFEVIGDHRQPVRSKSVSCVSCTMYLTAVMCACETAASCDASASLCSISKVTPSFDFVAG